MQRQRHSLACCFPVYSTAHFFRLDFDAFGPAATELRCWARRTHEVYENGQKQAGEALAHQTPAHGSWGVLSGGRYRRPTIRRCADFLCSLLVIDVNVGKAVVHP